MTSVRLHRGLRIAGVIDQRSGVWFSLINTKQEQTMHFFTQIDFRHLMTTIVVIAVLVVTQHRSRADLIVFIPDVAVAPGGTGVLDVLVSSDSLTGDSFQNFFLDFTISGAAQAASPISFVASIITAPQLTAMGPNYIFLGDSAEYNNPIGVDFVTDQPGNPIADDMISVLDETFLGADRTIDSGDGTFLLARLNFIAPLDATPGNIYDIQLENSSIFEDTLLNQAIFSANVGQIMISSTAVPEPSTFGVLAAGGLFLGWKRRRIRNTVAF